MSTDEHLRMEDIPLPDNSPGLLSVVRNLASQRRRAASLDEQARRRRHEAMVKKRREEKAERSMIRHQQQEARLQRHIRWRQWHAAMRKGRKVVNVIKKQLSRTEVDAQTYELLAETIRKKSLLPLRSESAAAWRKRIDKLNERALGLWNANREGIMRATGPRYVEGLPVDLHVRPPILTAHLPSSKMDTSDGRKCLQCAAKGMRCSQEVRSWVVNEPRWPYAPCRRCLRNGDDCLMLGSRRSGGGRSLRSQENRGWIFAEPPVRFRAYAEDAEVRREMQEAERLLAAELCDVRNGTRTETIGHRIERMGKVAPAAPEGDELIRLTRLIRGGTR